MADDKLNTGPEKSEGISPPEQSGPETRPTEEHTAESPPRPAPGEVVVDFDKINELMAQKRAAAREAVEKAEASTADKGGKEASTPTQEKKAPTADKLPKEQAGPTAEKKSKAAEPRTGRPSKVGKAAREEAPPSVRDKVVCTPSSGQRNNLHLRMKILPAHHMVLGTMQPADGHGLP